MISSKSRTMVDIAKEAGVSKSTVSRYFNGGYVKEDTKEKIRKIVERTGFEPSAAAQNLKAKKTHSIGVVAPTMISPSTGRLLTAMDNALRQQDYSCLIVTTDHIPEREIAAIEYLRSLRVAGIVLIATNISPDHQRLQTSSPIPFLTMGQKFPQGISIIYDDFEAGYMVGQYASQKGHKDIVYIGVNDQDEAVGQIRRDGVLAGLANQANVKNLQIAETTFSYPQARELVRQVLDDHIPELFICATDLIALACYKEIRERGLRVPEDVSLIGFGGYEMSELLSPSLATIRFENELAGKLCADTLISMIQKKPVPKVQMLGFEFLPGQSVLDRTQKRPDTSKSSQSELQ